jgi:peroxisomal 3,2-trans-enoyl-CoA isomerase
MYSELKSALVEASANDNILFVCITGSGDYYTSGNDLNNYTQTNGSDSIEELTKQATDSFREFIDTFIEFKKPIIGLVNGPAVGVGVSLLGLFDLVYASDKATFHTPFTKLALIPEACSSYTFPLIMGDLKAKEVLLFNRKLNAIEAYERGLVNEVIQNDKFQVEVEKRIQEFSKLPKNVSSKKTSASQSKFYQTF